VAEATGMEEPSSAMVKPMHRRKTDPVSHFIHEYQYGEGIYWSLYYTHSPHHGNWTTIRNRVNEDRPARYDA